MTQKAEKTGIHDGHRSRMRERFRKEGLDGFAPHEVLELLLFYGRARGDVNPIAHALIDHFGTLKGVLEASTEQLLTVPGVGEETATMISMILPMFRRYCADMMTDAKRICNRADAQSYGLGLLAGRRSEALYVISLSADHQVLGRRLIAEGSINEVNAYPRVVAEAALNHNAHSVILCHNHPGGVVTPSQADVMTTRMLRQLLAGLSVNLLDHIIIAGDQAYSMLQHGDLSFDDDASAQLVADSSGRVLPAKPKGRKRGN